MRKESEWKAEARKHPTVHRVRHPEVGPGPDSKGLSKKDELNELEGEDRERGRVRESAVTLPFL